MKGSRSKVYALFYDSVPLSNNGKFYAESSLYRKANGAGKGVQLIRNMGITNFSTTSGGKFVSQETVNTAQAAIILLEV